MSVEHIYIHMTLNLNRGDGVSVRARRRDGVDVAARVYGHDITQRRHAARPDLYHMWYSGILGSRDC